MSLLNVAGVASASLESPVVPASRDFAKVLATAHPPAVARGPAGRAPVDEMQVEQAARVLDRVNKAQARLDHILKVAQSGKTFTPAELLAFQAQVYQASQEIDLAGKVVDKATSGMKQVLQTQL